MDDPAGTLAKTVIAVVKEVDRYATAGQQLVDVVRACKLPLEILSSLAETDKDLMPDLEVAAASLSDVVDVVTRAHDFLLARRDTRLEAIVNGNINPLEGGTPT